MLLLLERFLPHYFKDVLSIYKNPGNFFHLKAVFTETSAKSAWLLEGYVFLSCSVKEEVYLPLREQI